MAYLSKRNPYLDVIRAIAVLMVLFHHIGFGLDVKTFSPWFRAIWWPFFIGGGVGVDLFFVLSGFLVSGLLFREYSKNGSIHILRFFVRRGFKIYPAFYVLLIVTLMLKLALGAIIDGHGFLFECVFLQNYGPSVWPHTWSLAVEEHAYLIIGFMLLVLSKRNRGMEDPFRALPVIFAAVALFCLALRIAVAMYVPFNSGVFFYPTHMRLDGLFYGVALSYAYHFREQWLLAVINRYRTLIWVASVSLVLLPFIFNAHTTPFMYTVGLTLSSFSGCGMVCLAVTARVGKPGRFVSWLARVGYYSYSIYLWHLPVLIWGSRVLARVDVPLYPEIIALIYFVVMIYSGIWLSRLIEVPFLKIRNRLFPSFG